MKYYFPDDYDSFSCLKGQCRHTCCAGWEIDIDSDTWQIYQELPGPVGEKVRASVTRTDDTVSFRLDKNGRCPMLNEENLCNLILAFGEDALCDICTDHPRYRNFFSDRVETGLGLCCEAAARQTVYRKTPYLLRLAVEEPGGAPLTEEEERIISFRANMAAIFQRENVPYEKKEEEALTLLPKFRWPGAEKDLLFLMKLERLDKAWESSLLRLGAARTRSGNHPAWDGALSQLAVSFLYRHLPDAADDGLLNARALFSLWSVRLIDAMTMTDDLDDLAETARAYSAEIEYSEDNLKACFSYLKACFL